MIKLNCWEYLNCGRQPGGVNVAELGSCKAATETDMHGINSGINGGRACWAIEKTDCGGKLQGSYAQKLRTCIQSDFFALMRNEENIHFQNSKQILMKSKKVTLM